VELSGATLTLFCGLLQARAFYGFQIAIENIHSGMSVWGLLPYEVSIYGIQILHFRVVCICVISSLLESTWSTDLILFGPYRNVQPLAWDLHQRLWGESKVVQCNWNHSLRYQEGQLGTTLDWQVNSLYFLMSSISYIISF
jgi:hypothetical protein